MSHTEQLRLWELASRLRWLAPGRTVPQPLRATVGPGITPPTHLTDPARTHLDNGAEPYRPIR